MKSTSPSSLVLGGCPDQFRPMAAAVIEAAGSGMKDKVPFDQFVQSLIQASEELQTSEARRAGIPPQVVQAHNAGWLQFGVDDDLSWIQLGSKV